jgi:hypothetical protein
MSNLFMGIYSGGEGREVHETFKRGAQAIKSLGTSDIRFKFDT